MERLGLEFETIPANVDESRSVGEGVDDLACRLAIEKARAVSDGRSWVVGADQVIALGDQVLSKPGTRERAVEQLDQLQGKVHRLLTAVAVVHPGGEEHTLVSFEMHMREWSRGELERYVDEDQPLDCAGSYKIEERGVRLFSKMVGDDYTAIVGLPLTRVWSLLESTGYPLKP